MNIEKELKKYYNELFLINDDNKKSHANIKKLISVTDKLESIIQNKIKNNTDDLNKINNNIDNNINMLKMIYQNTQNT
jgi:hypothetical protein